MELYATPDTLRAASLADMVQLLRDHRTRAVDYVAPAASLSTFLGDMVINGAESQLSDDGVTPVDGVYRMSRTAEQGLSAKLGIPQQYLGRMRREHIDLYDNNVNAWMGRQADSGTKYLVRLLRGGEPGPSPADGQANGRGSVPPRDTDGIVRAVLSDHYRIVDNLDFLLAVLAGVRDAGVTVDLRGCDLTEQYMYARLWSPEVAVMAPEMLHGYRNPFDVDGGPVRIGNGGWSVESARAAAAREGQGYEPGTEPIVFAGFEVSNSETGHGQFTIRPQLVVKICGNGLTLTAEAKSGRHLGARMDEGIAWSQRTQQKNTELITSQTADAVRKFLTTEWVSDKVAQLSEKAGTPVSKPAETITRVAKQLSFPDAVADEILGHFIAGGQLTAGGVMQAVSSVAQTVPSGELASELEAAAVPAMEAAAVLN